MDKPTRIKLILISTILAVYTGIFGGFIVFVQLMAYPIIKNVFVAFVIAGVFNTAPIWLAAIFPSRLPKAHQVLCYLSAFSMLFLAHKSGTSIAWFIETYFLQHKGIIFSPSGLAISIGLFILVLYTIYLLVHSAQLYAHKQIT